MKKSKMSKQAQPTGAAPKNKSNRKKTTGLRQPIRGQGGYFMPGTFSRVGREMGSALGGRIGEGAGALLSTVTGVGDYQVNNIVHADRALTSPLPKMYEFTNTELVQLVASPGTGFNVQSFSNNPGLSNFPWLSAIAGRFNKYRFIQLVYHFETTSSDYSAATGMGAVAIATNYDAADRAFRSMAEMEATENAVSGKPSVDKLHGVECAAEDDPLRWRYVRTTSTIPSNTDIRSYDHSDTYVATEGLSATSGTVLGRLKVFYTVQFTSPIALGIPPSYLPTPPCTRYFVGSGAGAGVAEGPFWGTYRASASPTAGGGILDTIPATFNTATKYGVASQAVFDSGIGAGAPLSFYASGTYRILAKWQFSTVPAGVGVTVSTAGSAVLYNPVDGSASPLITGSAARDIVQVEFILNVTSASPSTPAVVTIPSTLWGVGYVVSAANMSVSYLGPSY